MSIETMKLALEAAYLAGFNASGEGYNGEYPFGDKNQNPEHDSVWCKDRDNALEEALAKQEQGEPIGTAGELFTNAALERLDFRPSTKIYATPQRKPLTDEQIWDAYMKAPVDIDCHVSDLHKFARAIEAAHGIKE